MRKEIWSSGGGEETAGDSGGWRRLLDGSAPDKATCDFDEIFGFDPEALQTMKKTRYSRAVRSCVFRELKV